MSDEGQETRTAERRGLMMFGLIALTFGVVSASWLLGTESGSLFRKAMSAVVGGMWAPGAGEVMSAHDCHVATVLNTKDHAELNASFRERHPNLSGLPPTVVLCRMRAFQETPSCEAVAQTYANATGKTRFLVIVSQQTESGPTCELAYGYEATP